MMVAGRVSGKSAPALPGWWVLVGLKLLKEPPERGYTFLAYLSAWDDWPNEPRLNVIYQLREMTHPADLRVKVLVPGDDPVLPTVTALYLNADWHEREL